MKKVVLITGATQGLGLNIALHLSKKGYKVYGSFRKSSNIKKLNEANEKKPLNLSKIKLDVTKEKTISKAICKIIKKDK